MTRTAVLAERRAIVSANGHSVVVENRRIGARVVASGRKPASTGLTLSERMFELARQVRRIAGPSRTAPHRFTEVKDELAAELEQLAGFAQ